MKSSQKKKRVPLLFTANDNYSIFGIVSTEPDYKLSLLINKKFRLALKNQPPIEFTDEKGNTVSFSKFSDQTSSAEASYNMISNRSGIICLLKKLKSYDYLLLLQDSNENIDPALFYKSLKDSGLFTAVFPVDISDVNDKYLPYLIP